MKDLDGKTISVGSLLTGDFFFRVPEYQRPFSWDMDNFDDLIDDIITASQEQEYFLGTLVLHHQQDQGHYDIVDGQQRLTSLMVLLACLRDLIDEPEYKKPLNDKILQPANVVDGIPEKVRLEVKDREVFTEIVLTEGGTLPELNRNRPEPEGRYVDAVTAFKSKLAVLSQDEIKNIITFVSQKCIVIYLATSNFDDAFRLFTIVNDRGKQLRRIDILKAMNIAPAVITQPTVRDRVAQQWEDYEKELGESTFESVFHLVRLAILKDKPQGDLLKEFEKRIFPAGVVAKGEPFLNLIFEYVRLYRAIFMDRDFVPEESAEYNRYRAMICIMDDEFRASEWRACLLLFARRFGDEQFYEFLLHMEKVYLTHWVKGIRKDERYSDYAKVLAIIENAKDPDEVLAGVKYDAEAIKAAAGAADLYSPGYGKYFLLRLELVAAEHDVVREFHARSVEHVLPQTPEAEGYWADHHDLEETKGYVNSIGNLVLLSKSKNSAAKNYDFAKKKDKYLKSRVSDYPRSIGVLDYEDWDKSIIEARTAEARELILQDP